MTVRIGDGAISAMLEREKALFIQRNPKSKALADQSGRNWLRGVPMHWMVDWGTPFPLFVESAQGVDVTDADGHRYIDFCLGDTGAMFGHSPPPVVDSLVREAALGMTTMMPSSGGARVGTLLEDRFKLPCWQVTVSASDANRSVLRWCRAVTGRSKILVFNHCYHGAVDETFVTLDGGSVVSDPAAIGGLKSHTSHTRVVEFNDVEGVAAALHERDVACVLAEPIMTNVGMVLPDVGFLETLRQLTRETGTLLVMDETHCLSSGPGGYCAEIRLEPDAIIVGKPIAGGMAAAVYGFSAEVARRIGEYLATRTPGHSGIGTTLSGSRIQLALMETVLETYLTRASFAPCLALARTLEQGLRHVIERHRVSWHVVRAGVRVEFLCAAHPPRNGSEAAAMIHNPIDQAVHHHLLNRGIVMTPFHNMLLICPATTETHVSAMIRGVDQCLEELLSTAGGLN